jgi:hypothetical protein
VEHLVSLSRSLLVVCLVLVALPSADASLLIDDFNAPHSPEVPIINHTDPDPKLIETQDAAILGGERDMLLDVIGTPTASSLIGEIGGGVFKFGGSSPGTAAILQYDGEDTDEPGNADPVTGWPAALVHSEQLGGIDLTLNGHAFGLLFESIDGGGLQLTDIQVEVHAPTGGAAFAGMIPDSAAAAMYRADFTKFHDLGDPALPADPGVFANATSIEFRINPAGIDDVDFKLDRIIVTTPEPSTLVTWTIGLICVLGWARRRRGRGR